MAADTVYNKFVVYIDITPVAGTMAIGALPGMMPGVGVAVLAILVVGVVESVFQPIGSAVAVLAGTDIVILRRHGPMAELAVRIR